MKLAADTPGANDSGVPELDEPVHLCLYDGAWPDLYASEARRIHAALPPDVVIEHIGSTSVPGLLAKPIIDIMVGAEPEHSLDAVRAKLVGLGYEDMGEAGVPGRLYFRRRTGAGLSIDFNIALVSRGGPIWVANLALREYLRASPRAARAYAEVKKSAVENGAAKLLAYSEYKSTVLRRLIEQAVDRNRQDEWDVC